jgi:hypothetical protein
MTNALARRSTAGARAGVPPSAAGVLCLTQRSRSRRRVAVNTFIGLVVASLALLIGWVAVRPTLITLGSTAAERAAPMPGDAVVPHPRTVMDRAVTLPGPPQQV